VVKVKKESVEPNSQEGMDEDMLDIDNQIQIVKGSFSKRENVATGETGSKYRCILDACSNPACKTRPLSKLTYIKNNIQIQLKKYIKQYYQVSKLYF
jgi:hypothetical protein